MSIARGLTSLAAVAGLLCAGGCGGSSSHRVVAGCHLSARYLGGEGATGMLVVGFELSAPEPDRCTLRGYPRLRLIGQDGRRQASHTGIDRLHAPTTVRPVVVGGPHRAHFAVSYFYNHADGTACAGPQSVEILVPGVRDAIPSNIQIAGESNRRFTPCGGSMGVGPLESDDGVQR